MFRFSPALTFWWPVKVIEPDPLNPGKFVEQTFEAQLRLVDPDEAEASAKSRRLIVDRITPDISEEELASIQSELEAHDLEATRKVLTDWRKIEDEHGKPIPFNEDTFAIVYRAPRVQAALNRAYREAISEDKARLGN